MKRKHLSKTQSALILFILLVIHCTAVFSVWLLAEIKLPEFVCFLPLALPLAADIALRLKTDIKPFLTLIPSFFAVIVCFVFYLVCPNASDVVMFYGENYVLVLLALINFVVRCVYGIADVIILKRYSLVSVSILSVVLGVICMFAGFVFETDINQYFLSRNIGIADKTGSWGSINQNVERAENWQQIVRDTPFTLGEINSVTENGYTENYCSKGNYPHIDGSTVCVPMAVEFARQHLKFSDPAANQFVQFSTTHHAYENLMHKENTSQNYVHQGINAFIDMGGVDLVIATEPSDDEIAMAESLGLTLEKTPICYDAFVFITHKDNPVNSLTTEEIKKIYSGEITDWKELGGNNEEIRAFQREKNSGSQTAMENLVMGTDNMIDPIKVKVIEGMGTLVETVAEYENKTASIGYTYRYYIDTLYKNENIKTLAINGIAPTDDNIRSGKYPFTTCYYGVIRKGESNETGGKFLTWILSDEGQKCVAQAGYIALR